MEELVFQVFMASLPAFFTREKRNILDDVSERNLCARLQTHVERQLEQTELSTYHVDTEYNRKQQGQIKTIIDEDMVVIRVSCDLLIHSRGEVIEDDNLLALEMKKTDRPEQEKQDDRTRLRALTKSPYDQVWPFDGTTHPLHVCGYQVGIYMEIDRESRFCYFERYRGGEMVSAWRRQF